MAPPRRPMIAPVMPVIRQILDDDTRAPRKQRHTARRIWQRLKDDHGFTGGYPHGGSPDPAPLPNG